MKRFISWAGKTDERAKLVAGVVVGVVLAVAVTGFVALSLAVGVTKTASLFVSIAVAAKNQTRKHEGARNRK